VRSAAAVLVFTGAVLAAEAPRSAPPFSSPAAAYSGFSGAGEEVSGAGLGGWRSGREGVRYQGARPKPGWQLDWDAKGTSSELAIELGLLPALKPIRELHLRDTVIRKGGDGFFYMTGSTGDNIWDRNDGVELWRSRDLETWEYRGVVWRVDRDGTWQKRCRLLWAPEIHFLKGNYFVTYCMSGCANGGTGILKSASGRAEGPYVDALTQRAPLTGGIDATLFQDDDGSVYFTWGRGTTLFRMKDDLSAFADAGRALVVDDASLERARASGNEKGALFEGVSLFKHAGVYYLTGAVFIGGIDRATGRNGRYSSAVMTSGSLAGPYGQWHEAVPGGGGGNYFEHRGRWYCTLFGNDEAMPFREKPGLVGVQFEPDGRIAVAREQPDFVLRPGAGRRWWKERARP
jgi:xylan 1,4-beta-xylosidase